MPLYIGNEKIKEIYVSDNKIKEIYVGSELVYQSGPKELKWQYIGTSGNSDGIFLIRTPNYLLCRTYDACQSELEAARNPNDYVEGYIIRVEHSYEDFSGNEYSCDNYYFQVVAI